MKKKYLKIYDKAINPDFRKFQQSSKCPKCRKINWTIKIVSQDGTKIKSFRRLEQDDFGECKKCHYRIPVSILQSDEIESEFVTNPKVGSTTPKDSNISAEIISDVKIAIDNSDHETARKLLKYPLKDPTAETYFLAAQVALNEQQRKSFLKKAQELTDKD
jgi:predicted nucleic-acid-binding Zn-ribbon protein